MPTVVNMPYNETHWGCRGLYTGETNLANQPNGPGRLIIAPILNNKPSKYDGIWENGAMLQGTLKVNGDTFEGSFDSAINFDYGTYIYPNGLSYTGHFSNGMRNGIGSFDYLYCVYNGNWNHDKRSGTGTLTFPDGRVYDGAWMNDCATRGKFTDNGVIYDGTWTPLNGAPGIGTITWPNGFVADVIDEFCIVTTFEQYMTICTLQKSPQECKEAIDPISMDSFVVNGQRRLVNPLVYHIEKLSGRPYNYRIKLHHPVYASDFVKLDRCPECRVTYIKTVS